MGVLALLSWKILLILYLILIIVTRIQNNTMSSAPRPALAVASSSGQSTRQKIVRTVGIGATVVGSCIASMPYIISTQVGLRSVVSMVNTVVAPVCVSVEQAELGWARKPRLRGIGCSIDSVQVFQCDDVRASRTLWDIARRRHTDIFLGKPWVNLGTSSTGSGQVLQVVQAMERTKMIEEVPEMKLPESLHATSGENVEQLFSAEMDGDDVSVFVSEGVISMPNVLSDMIGGRLFYSIGKHMDSISFDMDSPSLHMDVQGSLKQGDALAFTHPLTIKAHVTQAFSDAFLQFINPMLIGGVQVHSESPLVMYVQPDGDLVIPTKSKTTSPPIIHVRIQPHTMTVQEGSIFKDMLRVLSRWAPDLKAYKDNDHQLIMASCQEISCTIHPSGVIHSTVKSVSTKIPGYPHDITFGVQATLQGPEKTDDIQLDIHLHGETLANVFRLKHVPEDVVLKFRGTVAHPKLLLQPALVQLGLLLAQQL